MKPIEIELYNKLMKLLKERAPPTPGPPKQTPPPPKIDYDEIFRNAIASVDKTKKKRKK